MVEIKEQYVVLDIETKTFDENVDPEKDELRYVGLKAYNGNKVIYHFSELEKIQKAVDYFPIIVGHNILEYDKPVLERYGIVFNKKIIIDTLQIARTRYKQMLYIDLPARGYSLRNLCERFDLESKKGEFDYSLLQKEILEGKEYDWMAEYLYGDLDSTDDLFKFNYNLFYGLKQFVDDYGQRYMKWLTASSGATAYKIICNMAGLKEEYEDIESEGKQYSGGFVSLPYVDVAEGNIYCIDFASLYPHMFMGGNLYSPVPKTKGWNGSGMYPSVYANELDGLVGTYSRQMGIIEKTIQKLYGMRVESKKKKDKQLTLAIKIVINTIYGISGSPKFKSVYNKTTASDCTAMARRTIKHARTVLQENGYECLYTDTDSVYVLDPFKNKKKLEKITELISQSQIASMNIPISTHFFEIETDIKRIYFFKDDKGEYIKKHYIYVTQEGKIKEKGLKIIKGDSSPLSVKVYNEYIKKQIEANKYEMYEAEDLYSVVKEFSSKNPELLVKRFRSKPLTEYKTPDGKDEPTCMGYQVSKKYGPGEHYLVPNKRIGVGKGKKYATIDELKSKYGETWTKQLRIDSCVQDLSEFILPKDRNKIEKLDRKRES